MNRRSLIQLAALAAAPLSLSRAQAEAVDRRALTADPEAPTVGNPQGDLTIVAFTDYNCPYCKSSAGPLDRTVKADGRIRLVYKDWPILAESSVFGAQLALGAHRQGRYETVHMALMGIPDRGASQERMLAAVRATGIDMARLQADLDAHSPAIIALLRRNMAQAEALGLRGTPTFLIGPLRTMALDDAGFRRAVAEARRRQAGN